MGVGVEWGEGTLIYLYLVGLQEIADAVFSSALHVCTTADRQLLSTLHKDMELRVRSEHLPASPLPTATWHESVFSDRTCSLLKAHGETIRKEVLEVARQVGAKTPKLANGAAIQQHYLHFFAALADSLLTPEQQSFFMRKACSTAAGMEGHDFDFGKQKAAVFSRLHEHLTSPVPADFSSQARQNRTKVVGRGSGTYRQTHQRAKDIFFGEQEQAGRSRL